MPKKQVHKSEDVLLFSALGEEALKSINCKDEEMPDEDNQYMEPV